jgi:Tol biopolymer transport system component
MRSTTRVTRLSVALIFSIFSIFSFVTGAAIAEAFAGQTTRVSVSSSGVTADSSASSAVLSADGRYAVFASAATNLRDGVATTGTHVYRHDRTTGRTDLVSVTPAGAPGNDVSRDPSLSADGRFVVFGSFATDLVAGDTNLRQDVFVRDMVTGTTRLVSGATEGVVGLPAASSLSGLSGAREISDDGRFVVFNSFATNLVAGATNGTQHVYVKDMTTGAVVRASVNDAGEPGNRASQQPAISGDGRVVAFQSFATNFTSSPLFSTPQIFVRVLPDGPTTLETPGAAAAARRSAAPTLSFDGRYLAFESDAALDTADLDNGTTDVFLRDRETGSTVLASLSPNTVAGAFSARPSISGDGRWVAFDSLDELLVTSDLNGYNDVYLYDRDQRAVVLVSLNDAGEQANWHSGQPLGGASVSSNGQVVLFGSVATNLVAAPSNGQSQLYVRKMVDDTPPPPPPAQVTFEWLAPVSDTFSVNRNLPVKFTLHDLDGGAVFDTSVQVDVVDSSGAVVAGTYVFGDQPSRSVTWSSETYHVNVDTRSLEPGMYWLRVRFSSTTLSAEFTLATNATASAVRSRLRD